MCTYVLIYYCYADKLAGLSRESPGASYINDAYAQKPCAFIPECVSDLVFICSIIDTCGGNDELDVKIMHIRTCVFV